MKNLVSITQEELQNTINEAVQKSLATVKKEIANTRVPSFATSVTQEEVKSLPLIGAYVRNLIVANKEHKSFKEVTENYVKKSNSKAGAYILKGLNETNAVDGGVFVIPEVSDQFIELLTAKNVIRGLNVQNISISSASIEMTREDVGAGAFWTTENPGAVSKSNPEYGKYTLTPKKLMSWATISNDLLMDAAFNVEQILQDQIIRAASQKEEVAFIYGGGANEPKGLYAWMAAGNKIPSSGTTAELIEEDLFAAELGVNSTSVSTELVWLMPYRVFSSLRTKMRDVTGQIAFPELRNEIPTLLGHKVVITNNIPVNLGVGADETNIFLFDPSEFVIVDRVPQEFKVNPVQNDSNFPVGIDETLVVSISRVDSLLKHSTKAAVIEGVAY